MVVVDGDPFGSGDFSGASIALVSRGQTMEASGLSDSDLMAVTVGAADAEGVDVEAVVVALNRAIDDPLWHEIQAFPLR